MDLFWENDGWEGLDPHLKTLRSQPFQRPFPRSQLPGGLWIIRGPRQVGKSSWLKHLLSGYPNPKRAYYRSCENITDYQQLGALLETLAVTRDLILLDEISFVKGWARAIKHFLDSGYGGTLVLTGSHAVDLRRGADLLPGRFGGGEELLLLPMDFDEYQAMRLVAGWPPVSRSEALVRYFRCGGFPTAVVEAGPDGAQTPRARETYRRWLSGDLVALGKQEIYLREILGQLALTATSTLSLQTVAKRAQFGSHHTAQEYISMLEDCFALRTLYALDLDKQSILFRREKKFYFTDPLIYWLALEWAGMRTPVQWEAVLAEQVAHEALVRAAQKHHEKIGYFRSGQGEIDFVGVGGWAVEIKWSDDVHNLSKAYRAAPIADKQVWGRDNFGLSMPLSLRTR